MQKRFTSIHCESIRPDDYCYGQLEIIRDNETGIEYLILRNGSAIGGITPLLYPKDINTNQ